MPWLYIGPPGGFGIILLLLIIDWCRRHPTKTILWIMLISIVAVITLVASAIGSCIDHIRNPDYASMTTAQRQEWLRQIEVETKRKHDSIHSLPVWKALNARMTELTGQECIHEDLLYRGFGRGDLLMYHGTICVRVGKDSAKYDWYKFVAYLRQEGDSMVVKDIIFHNDNNKQIHPDFSKYPRE